MPKIILLNGPARSGKDFAAAHLMQAIKDDDPIYIKMSAPLKKMASALLVENENDLDAFKNTQLPIGASFRDIQIMIYEAVSQMFTKAWLGHAFVRTVNKIDASVVIGDVGRDEDLEPVIKAFGPKNVLVAQIFRDGCSFDNDIRYYVTDQRTKRVTLFNDGTGSFKTKLDAFVLDFLS